MPYYYAAVFVLGKIYISFLLTVKKFYLIFNVFYEMREKQSVQQKTVIFNA